MTPSDYRIKALAAPTGLTLLILFNAAAAR